MTFSVRALCTSRTFKFHSKSAAPFLCLSRVTECAQVERAVQCLFWRPEVETSRPDSELEGFPLPAVHDWFVQHILSNTLYLEAVSSMCNLRERQGTHVTSDAYNRGKLKPGSTTRHYIWGSAEFPLWMFSGSACCSLSYRNVWNRITLKEVKKIKGLRNVRTSLWAEEISWMDLHGVWWGF
jgi:hypothetical protein